MFLLGEKKVRLTFFGRFSSGFMFFLQVLYVVFYL